MANKNKIALSFDLDDWYHTPVITGSSFSIYKTVDEFFQNWSEPFDFITEATLELLALLKKFDVTATFFVIADQVERYPEIMKTLRESSHEIACHSLHHQVPFDSRTKKLIQTEAEWEADLITAKNILEKEFDREIIGYRAPGAYFANWMLPILVRNGFRYDSSLSHNSLYNKTDMTLANIPEAEFGMKSNGEICSVDEGDLIEFPWASYSMLGFRVPTAGAFFFRLFGYSFFKSSLNQNLKKHNTMFYLHPLDLSRHEIPLHNNRKRPLYWINKGKKTVESFEKLLGSFQGCWSPYREILSFQVAE